MKAPSRPSELAQDRAKEIYQNDLAARKRCNQSTDDVSFRQVAKSLNQKYVNNKGGVDFKVVIRKGKAVITAVRK